MSIVAPAVGETALYLAVLPGTGFSTTARVTGLKKNPVVEFFHSAFTDGVDGFKHADMLPVQMPLPTLSNHPVTKQMVFTRIEVPHESHPAL